MKRVNWTALTVIIGIAFNIGLSIWWTSKLDSRVCNLEKFAVESRVQLDQIASMRLMDETLLRTLNEVKVGQDRLLDRMWQLHSPDHTQLKDVGK